jgi:hypothetical protein
MFCVVVLFNHIAYFVFCATSNGISAPVSAAVGVGAEIVKLRIYPVPAVFGTTDVIGFVSFHRFILVSVSVNPLFGLSSIPPILSVPSGFTFRKISVFGVLELLTRNAV